MKKGAFLRTVICCTVALSSLSCGGGPHKTETGAVYNSQFNENKMYAITGKKKSLTDSNVHVDRENGFAFVFPQEFAREDIPLRAWNLSSYSYDIVYFPPDKMELLKAITDDMADESALEQYLQAVGSGIYVCSVFRSTEFLEYEGLNALMESLYPSVEFLGTVEGSSYYFACLSEIPETVDATDREKLALLAEAFPELKNSIMLFPGLNGDGQ